MDVAIPVGHPMGEVAELVRRDIDATRGEPVALERGERPVIPDVVRFTFEPGPIRTETITCHGIDIPFSGTTLLSPWATLGTERPVALDGSVVVNGTVPGGTSRLTISIKKVPTK